MKEENNRGSKNKWTRIFRKKWFYPALYLVLAVVFLSGIVWYQNVSNEVPDAEQSGGGMEDYNPNLYDEDAEPVTQQEEVIRMPVADEEKAEIVSTFFDYNAPAEERASSLIHYNNRYYQNEGVAISSSEETSFDVTAAISGTVETVKEDPLLGKVVMLSHGEDTKTYYASLEEVVVKEGQKLEQGDLIGNAGESLLGGENGIHVHFEIIKNGKKENPEVLFNQPVSSIGSLEMDKEEAATEATEEGTEEETEDEAADETTDKTVDETEDEDKGAERDEQEDDDVDQDAPISPEMDK